jgi:hypothetical protein
MADNELIGYSPKINDPAFARYIKSSNSYSAYFSVGLALIAVIGFFIAGETSDKLKNPEALYYGLAIGGMFLLIALYQIIGRKRSKTWDGTVTDKKVLKKSHKRNMGDDDYVTENYLEYQVVIKSDTGKKHTIRVENNDTLYNYYNTGDKVRHHKGLNTFEKYDKSRDTIIFCNACSSLNPIENDFCFRCKCPLLKGG